jgi:hypothetical protein
MNPNNRPIGRQLIFLIGDLPKLPPEFNSCFKVKHLVNCGFKWATEDIWARYPLVPGSENCIELGIIKRLEPFPSMHSEWTAEGVAERLEAQGLGAYKDAFIANEISGSVLLDMNEEHLRELGLTVGARIRFARWLKTLKSSKVPPKADESEQVLAIRAPTAAASSLNPRSPVTRVPAGSARAPGGQGGSHRRSNSALRPLQRKQAASRAFVAAASSGRAPLTSIGARAQSGAAGASSIHPSSDSQAPGPSCTRECTRPTS